MIKKPSVIIFFISLVGLLIFSTIWSFLYLFPLIDLAQSLEGTGITIGGTIWDVLEFLFLNVSFYGMVVCGVVALIFRLIAWKSLKSI